ncbi:hypothetical protein ON010_g12323 [Phytophthora cinnamomi]|nr:hypothetical protein ON010_g12323 [Phytophthora cinnamomi]
MKKRRREDMRQEGHVEKAGLACASKKAPPRARDERNGGNRNNGGERGNEPSNSGVSCDEKETLFTIVAAEVLEEGKLEEKQKNGRDLAALYDERQRAKVEQAQMESQVCSVVGITNATEACSEPGGSQCTVSGQGHRLLLLEVTVGPFVCSYEGV